MRALAIGALFAACAGCAPDAAEVGPSTPRGTVAPGPATSSSAPTPSAAGPASLRLNRRGQLPFHAALWSPDGRWLVSWCGSSCDTESEQERQRIVVWSLPDLTVRAELLPAPEGDMGQGRIHNLGFSSDGARLAISTHNEVTLWRTDDFSSVVRVPMFAVYGGFEFSPDGRYLAMTGVYGQLQVVDAATGADLLTATLHNGAASYSAGVSWTKDSRWLVAEGNASFGLWKVGTKKLAALDDFGGQEGTIATSRDDKWLLIAGVRSCQASLYSMETQRLARRIDKGLSPDAPSDSPSCLLEFSPSDDHLFAAIHADGGVRLWRAGSNQRPVAVHSPGPVQRGHMPQLSFSRDGKRLVWSVGEAVGVWNVERGVAASAPSGPIGSATWASERVLAVSTQDEVAYFDTETGQLLAQPPPGIPEGIADPSGKLRVIATGDLRFVRNDGAELLVRSVFEAGQRRTVVVDVSGRVSGDAALAASDVYDERRGAAGLPAPEPGVAARFFGGR